MKIGNNSLTLLDVAKRLGPDGKVDAQIIEILAQSNPILDDMLFLEANNKTGHRTTIRTGLPEAYWRMLNRGVPRGKSSTAQVDEATGMLETYSLVDKALIDMSKDPVAVRMSEDAAFLEGMAQQMATAMFYGNPAVEPAAFMGLAPRYNTLDAAKSQTATNVIDAGGTGTDNTSVWLVGYGDRAIHGIYPEGSKAGVNQQDVTTNAPVLDADGRPYQAYQTHFKWDAGLVVRDWRYAVRICNIDVSNLANGPDAEVDAGANLIELMVKAIHKIPNLRGASRFAFYCNRTVGTYLDIQRMQKTNVELTLQSFDGGAPVTAFRGIPVRECDALLNTEARVV